MNKLLLLTIGLFYTLSLYSQVNIGKRGPSPISFYTREHSKEVFANLKNTTTYFVVPKGLNKPLDEVEDIIGGVWDFNKIVFIDENEFSNNKNKYYSETNSVIKLVSDFFVRQKVGNKLEAETRGEAIMHKFILIDYLKNENGLYSKTIAEIFFTPNIRLATELTSKVEGNSIEQVLFKKRIRKIEALEKPGYYNFDMGYIKNYFQFLNDKLKKSQNLKMYYDEIKNSNKLQELKAEPLYVPDWILRQVEGGFYKNTIAPEKMFKNYEYEYDIITNDALNNKILEGDKINYLMYTKINGAKILSIINGHSGDIVYLKRVNSSWNVKSKDLKEISKLIK